MCKLECESCHVGVRQVMHTRIHSEVDSLEQTPTGPHYSGTAELPFNYTYAQINLCTSETHTK